MHTPPKKPEPIGTPSRDTLGGCGEIPEARSDE